MRMLLSARRCLRAWLACVVIGRGERGWLTRAADYSGLMLRLLISGIHIASSRAISAAYSSGEDAMWIPLIKSLNIKPE